QGVDRTSTGLAITLEAWARITLNTGTITAADLASYATALGTTMYELWELVHAAVPGTVLHKLVHTELESLVTKLAKRVKALPGNALPTSERSTADQLLGLAMSDVHHYQLVLDVDSEEIPAQRVAMSLTVYGRARFPVLAGAVTLVGSGHLDHDFLAVRNADYEQMIARFNPRDENLDNRSAALDSNTTMLELRAIGHPSEEELRQRVEALVGPVARLTLGGIYTLDGYLDFVEEVGQLAAAVSPQVHRGTPADLAEGGLKASAHLLHPAREDKRNH